MEHVRSKHKKQNTQNAYHNHGSGMLKLNEFMPIRGFISKYFDVFIFLYPH